MELLILVNAFFMIFSTKLAYENFRDGYNDSGWFNLVVSAANTAAVMAHFFKTAS